MAQKIITVRQNSSPGDQTFVLRDARNETDSNAAVDITGYAFKLVVKRDLEDADANALFDLTGAIVTAADGSFKFVLTTAHTAYPPGTYPAEIRWWSGGAPGTEEPPTDAWSVDFVIEQSVRRAEP